MAAVNPVRLASSIASSVIVSQLLPVFYGDAHSFNQYLSFWSLLSQSRAPGSSGSSAFREHVLKSRPFSADLLMCTSAGRRRLIRSCVSSVHATAAGLCSLPWDKRYHTAAHSTAAAFQRLPPRFLIKTRSFVFTVLIARPHIVLPVCKKWALAESKVFPWVTKPVFSDSSFVSAWRIEESVCRNIKVSFLLLSDLKELCLSAIMQTPTKLWEGSLRKESRVRVELSSWSLHAYEHMRSCTRAPRSVYRHKHGKRPQMVNIAHREWVITSQAESQSVYSNRTITKSATTPDDQKPASIPRAWLRVETLFQHAAKWMLTAIFFFPWPLFRVGCPVGCPQSLREQEGGKLVMM